MADVLPFPAVRYSDKIEDKSKVITPPYDIISPKQQDMYYERDKNNIIRIDFGKDLPGDNEEQNKYSRASACFNEWLEKGILKKESKPAFYVYHMEYIHPYTGEAKTLKGFFGLVKAEPFEKGVVLPHEHTFPSHKKDRLELLKKCRANISAVFSLYSDKNNEIMNNLSVTAALPVIDVADDDGNRHKLWKVTEGVEKITKSFKDRKIYIADGHHRYSTSVTYREDRNAVNDNSADYIMMFLVCMEDPGVSILPTHRVFTGIKSKEWLLHNLEDKFDMEKWENKGDDTFIRFQENLRAEQGHAFGLVFSDDSEYFVVRLKKEKKDLLDVEVLRNYVMEWIYSKEEIYSAEKIKYVKDPKELVKIVKECGPTCAGFLLNPTRLDELVTTVEQGAKMPHKSTYFYPKPATGLLLYKFD